MLGVAFLKDRVRDAVVSDIVDVARLHADRNASVPFGGCLGIPRDVFCVVDFLGAFAYENEPSEHGASSRKAVHFLEDYFPERYRAFAPLIVHMWRHGTVHNLQPLTYSASIDGTRVTITWSSNNGIEPHNRAVHLRLLAVGGDRDSVNLAMNVCELADDLLTALDRFIDAIEADASFGGPCLERMDSLQLPQDIDSLTHSGRELKALLKQQIEDAQSSTSGTIRGTQVE